MSQRLYPIGELAKKASVSIRTLRYYDHIALLTPSQHSENGYRLYTEADVVRLQQILALKYVGFTLEEIKLCLQTGPQQLSEHLAQQQAMLEDKRAQLDLIILTLDASRRRLEQNPDDHEALTSVLHVYQAERQQDKVRQHLTPAQRLKLRELYEASYSEEAKHALETRVWEDEERQHHHQQYEQFRAALQHLTAIRADPASAEAQQMAQILTEINARVSQGNPHILAGMKQTWSAYNAMPDAERPATFHFTDEERDFLKRTMIVYNTPVQ